MARPSWLGWRRSWVRASPLSPWTTKTRRNGQEKDGIAGGQRAAQDQDDKQNVRKCGDQLARQWIDLCKLAPKRGVDGIGKALVYLTADVSFPYEEIQASIDDIRRNHRGSPDPVICWLSWRELHEQIVRGHPDNSILAVLARGLKELELTMFHGFAKATPINLGWRFAGPSPVYRFQAAPVKLQWSFER